MRKIFFIAFIISSLLLTRAVFGYDDKTTHPALTDEAVDFYNFNSSQKITNEEKEWIVEGSILEDTEPRYVNHFYDPIYKVGWTGERGVIPQETMQKLTDIAIAPLGAVSALNWVHNQELQAKYQRYLGNKTWEKAIYEYVKNNNKQEAYLALGHVLHLLEDMAVPEHTRNDTHTPLNESPYESYASRYNRDNINIIKDIKNQNPPIFNSLDEYFEELANYSNQYFFSRDTVNDRKYSKPEIIREDGNYAYGLGKNGDEFKLARERREIKDGNLEIVYFLNNKEEEILESYFTRLSRATVLNGAGVLALFFREAEKAENDPSLLKPPPENQSAMLSIYGEIFKIKKAITNVSATIKNTASNLWNNLTATGQPASVAISNLTSSQDVRLENAGQAQDIVVPAAPPADETPGVSQTTEVGSSQTVVEEVPQTTTVVGSSADIDSSSRQAQPSAEPKPVSDLRTSQDHILVPAIPPEPAVPPTTVVVSPAPSFTPSLPNPGFGGGSLESSLSSEALAQEELSSEALAQEEPPPQDVIAPNPPVIVSPADFSPAFTSTDISFSGAAEASSTVSNDFNNSKTTADANGLWSLSFSFSQGSTTIKFFSEDAAGNISGSTNVSLFVDSVSPTIQTFSVSECAASFATTGCLVSTTTLHLSWQSSAGDLEYFELTINSDTSTTTATSTIISVSDNSTNNFSLRARDVSGNWSDALSLTAEISLTPVIINEIAWAGTSASFYDEWIELFNKTSETINLNNWVLYSQTDMKPYINLTGTIPAHGYYLLERKDNETISDIAADQIYGNDGPDWALNNTGEILILSFAPPAGGQASTTIDQTPNGSWPGGDSNIYRTMERYNPNSSGADSSSWGTNNIVVKNGKNADNQNINGTPKERNSANYLINKNNPAFSSSLTLTKSNSPYLVDNTLMNIGANATLIIEPGVTIKFYNDAGFSVLGKIISQGTDGEPVIFESFDNNYWYGVDVFSEGSVFDHSIFRKGGKYYSGSGRHMANLFIKDFPATITNSIFEYSQVYGLKLENSNSIISNNIIRHNNNETDPAGYSAGLVISNGSPSIQSNAIENNQRGIYSFSPLATINANTFSANVQEAIFSSGIPANFTNNSGAGSIFLSSGNISQSGATTTLKANSLPYAFNGNITIPTNSGLIIESGVVANVSGGFFGGRMDVYGNLVLSGANSGDIIFSSGYASPAAGDWQGIRVYGRSDIKGTTFKHAAKAISYYNSPIKLENIRFENNNLAVYADGASAGQTIYGGQSITALLIEFINQIATTSPIGLW